MTATVRQARDDINGVFHAAWSGDPATTAIPVQYQDTPAGEFPPKTQGGDNDPTPWARVTLLHNPGAGGESTLAGGTGKRRYTRLGQVVVNLFGPSGDGFDTLDDMTRVAMQAFEGVRTTNGVWFRDVRFSEIGQDGAYFQVNVLADFEYDEVR